MRTVTINKVLNGIKVQVGCTELVFNHVEEFITAFREYAANPEKVEKEWLTRFGQPTVNGAPTPARFDNQCAAAPPVPTPVYYEVTGLGGSSQIYASADTNPR